MSNRKRTRVRAERANAETAAVATPEIPGGYPDLTASQLDLIRERSTDPVRDPSASLGDAGDVDYDFVLVEAGDVEVVRFAAFGLPEQVMAIFGLGSFLGELDMLTGQAAMFSARMPAGGVIQRMPRPVFRQLMSDAPEARVARVPPPAKRLRRHEIRRWKEDGAEEIWLKKKRTAADPG